MNQESFKLNFNPFFTAVFFVNSSFYGIIEGMTKPDLQTLLTDSYKRARFFAMFFAVFAVIYHVVFIILFYRLKVWPMVFMNFYSVPFFTLLTVISPKRKSYIGIYLFSCLEVYTHQTLGVYCLGIGSGYHFFFIPFALLPLFTFQKKFSLAMLFTLLGGAWFLILQALSSHFPPVYTVPENVLSAFNFTNILLAVIIILVSTLIYAFIVSNSEKILEGKVEKKTNEVLEIHRHTVNSLANLVESRDSDTGEHIQKLSKSVEYIALEAFKRGIYPDVINPDFIDRLKRAAPLHDVGKIVIADAILKKPAHLTTDEFEIIKTHTTEGRKIVREIIGISEDSDYIRISEEIAYSHHERWDGKGYPEGLRENEIPVSARILAIADVFDALVSNRCYKTAYSNEEACSIIEEESGTHFDPLLARLFLDVKDDFIKTCYSEKN